MTYELITELPAGMRERGPGEYIARGDYVGVFGKFAQLPEGAATVGKQLPASRNAAGGFPSIWTPDRAGEWLTCPDCRRTAQMGEGGRMRPHACLRSFCNCCGLPAYGERFCPPCVAEHGKRMPGRADNWDPLCATYMTELRAREERLAAMDKPVISLDELALAVIALEPGWERYL